MIIFNNSCSKKIVLMSFYDLVQISSRNFNSLGWSCFYFIKLNVCLCLYLHLHLYWDSYLFMFMFIFIFRFKFVYFSIILFHTLIYITIHNYKHKHDGLFFHTISWSRPPSWGRVNYQKVGHSCQIYFN